MMARFASVVLSSLLIAGAAIAEETSAPAVGCKVDEVPAAPKSYYFLTAPRELEWWLSLGAAGDWVSRGQVTPSLTLGTELVRPFDAAQRWRAGVYVGGVLGHWGDDAHSVASFEAALRFRYSPIMNDLLDAYVVLSPGILVGFDPSRTGLRLGAGLGARIVRAAALEATADQVVALGDAFANGEHNGWGMTFALAGDLCAFAVDCSVAAPPAPVAAPQSCVLYDAAFELCRSNVDRHALCDVAARAMDSGNVGDAPKDPTDAYLGLIEKLLPKSDLKDRITAIRKLHEKLLQNLDEVTEAQRQAQQRGTWLRQACSYGPNAVELRDAFGCTATGNVIATCALPPECR